MDELLAALVGIHALAGTELMNLQLTDLDLAAGRLRVRRDHGIHTVYLDIHAHQLAAGWLAERHRRRPASTDPRVLVTRRTAMDSRHPAVSGSILRHPFGRRGPTMQRVRQDRILDEARQTADPIHLFGITAATAIKYLAAAHPERTA